MLIYMFAFFYTIASSLSDITQIHKEMTKRELRFIFQTSPERVPVYEVVPIIHNFQKRSIDFSQIVRLNAFGRSVSLYLNPADVLLAGTHTPVWTVIPHRMSPEGLQYNRINDAFRKVGIPYQDTTTQSAVVLNKDKFGTLKLHGNILKDYLIRPLPNRFTKRLSRERRNLNITMKHHIEKDYHIIYRQPKFEEKNYNGIRVVGRDHVNSSNLINRQYENGIPYTIFPELLVILDYNLYQAVGHNYHAAILYLLSFWNAVDLRYRINDRPQIRLNLAALIISIGRGGTPYLDNNRRAGGTVDADKSLEAMSKYYFQESRFPFETYDMAIALTNLDICNVIEDQDCDTSTLGYAYEAGACNRSSIDRNTEAVGIIEDNGGYSAILPATHEVAHLLGSPHDGVTESFDCSGDDGYIMTREVTFSENSFRWSSCTRRAINRFLSSANAHCLFNVPHKGKQLLRILPGKLKTLDEQCEKVFGSRACNYDSSVCTRLECYVPEEGGYCKAIAAAAEGSYCGWGMHCINGQCIAENAKIIPNTIATVELPFSPQRLNNYRINPWTKNL